MVGVTKIQRGNAGYWLAAVAKGEEDYYNKPGDAPGRWMGGLADELGLSGQVDPDGYTAILEGRDPNTGGHLVERPESRVELRADGREKRIDPVLGYDIRFSAPKSVSLLYAFGDQETRERVAAIVYEAVEQGLAHLEDTACYVRRGSEGTKIERGSGFVGMAFRHHMSRAGDPDLHIHLVVSNATRAAGDGKWLSLASPKGRSALYPHSKSAGVGFQAALRAGMLREFGLEFSEVTNGHADLLDFTREQIECFSTRSREIAVWLDQHGVSSPAAAQTAAYQTRDAKDYDVDPDSRFREWEQRAEPLGLSREDVEEMIAQARPREPRLISDEDLHNAVAALEQSTSHFDRRQLLWAIADQLPEGADIGHLTAARDRVLASELVVQIHDSTGPLDANAYTTPRLLALEEEFIATATAGTDDRVGIVPGPTLDRVLGRHPYLGADQREMVARLTTDGDRIALVAAWPGTGKTTALEATAQAWTEAGYPVVGCATSWVAAGEMKDAGVLPSVSIASLLSQAEGWREAGRRLPDSTVIVVDEANVTSTSDLYELLRLVIECDGKLVLIGDPRQISPIGPGGIFIHLTAMLEPISLTEIRRQRKPADRRIVSLVHEGRGSQALDLLRTEGKLIVADNLPSTLHALLLDWHEDFISGADAVMIARRNRDVDFLNEQARLIRHEEGRIGEQEVIVGEHPIAVGDRVQTRINGHEVNNRERWDVTAADPTARTLTLRRVAAEEREVTLGPGYLDLVTNDGAPAVQYAYAITKFGAESKTFDRAYPLLDAESDLEQELVAISRGREVANVYAVASSQLLDPDFGPARRELTDAVQDVREGIERHGAEEAATEVSLRRAVEGLSGAGLAERRRELRRVHAADDPHAAHRARLEDAIARDRSLIDRLASERQELEAQPTSDAQRLTQVLSAEVNTTRRVEANLAERDELPEPNPPSTEALKPQERLEAALIELRIGTLASREITAARAGESKPIYAALGSYPTDPAQAAAWADGAHAIATYRNRHDISDPDTALGSRPRSAATLAEYEDAQKRVDRALRQLQPTQERAPEHSRDAELGLER